MTKVSASICPNCLDLIFSRARHDFHHCSCEEIFIDGGFDYTRGGWKNEYPYQVNYEVEQSKNDLYRDYALMEDKYGIVKDWTMSILDFFSVQDGRHIQALKGYADGKPWPESFPVEHLTFPEGWFNQLTSRILTFLSEPKKEE